MPEVREIQEARPAPARDALGRFPKGLSGNPGGVSASRKARQEAVNAEDPARVTAVLQALFDLATVKGDVPAARCYLEVVGVLGKNESADIDLSDAPQETLEYLQGKLAGKYGN
jgi:hypothetical protein